mmetsp:Transcript_14481/g.41231  ORF Transcript_14481/g.41231 Transcript_14481/m.41231 type:complete len:258 (+) Transcript_14481:393-1166(+)
MVKLTAILILKWNGEATDPHMLGLASDLTQVSRSPAKKQTHMRRRVFVFPFPLPLWAYSWGRGGGSPFRLLTLRASRSPFVLFYLSQFGYFERPVVRDMLNFVSRTIVKRTQPGQRQTVEHQEYLCHAFNKEGVAAITFADKTYPRRSAFCVINKVLDDYLEKFGQNWRNHSADTNEGNPILEAALREYQDPSKADNLLRVQKELDETKIVLHKTIDSVLARGEKLDNLVAKSSDLSVASQMFYRTARKQNQCCKMM